MARNVSQDSERNERGERRLSRRGQQIGTNVGALIADAIAAKSHAAGDRRTEAQRAHVVDWSKRGRAFRSELIAAGVLLPPGYTHERAPRVLEIDRAAAAEAAREIFFDTSISERCGAEERDPLAMAQAVAEDPASDPDVVAALYAWRDRYLEAASLGEVLERPAAAGQLPPGYERDYFDWCDTQKAARREERKRAQTALGYLTKECSASHAHCAWKIPDLSEGMVEAAAKRASAANEGRDLDRDEGLADPMRDARGTSTTGDAQ